MQPVAPAAAGASALVPLATQHGQRLLRRALGATSPSAEEPPVVRHFEAQRHNTACGAATAAVLYRAVEGGPGGLGDEDAVLARGHEAGVISEDSVREIGMTLQEHRALLEVLFAHRGARVQATHADGADETYARFLADLQGLSPTTLVSVNYSMKDLGQDTEVTGHLSPVAAVVERGAADEAAAGAPAPPLVLVMDVWPLTGPLWAPADALWGAMTSHDPDSGRPRGWCRVELGG